MAPDPDETLGNSLIPIVNKLQDIFSQVRSTYPGLSLSPVFGSPCWRDRTNTCKPIALSFAAEWSNKIYIDLAFTANPIDKCLAQSPRRALRHHAGHRRLETRPPASCGGWKPKQRQKQRPRGAGGSVGGLGGWACCRCLRQGQLELRPCLPMLHFSRTWLGTCRTRSARCYMIPPLRSSTCKGSGVSLVRARVRRGIPARSLHQAAPHPSAFQHHSPLRSPLHAKHYTVRDVGRIGLIQLLAKHAPCVLRVALEIDAAATRRGSTDKVR